MKKLKGVFLDAATLGTDIDLSVLERKDIEWDFYDYTPKELIQQRLSAANIVITNKVVLNSETLRAIPSLKLICVAATGMNNIDLDASKQLDIAVKNVVDYAGSSIAQLVFSYVLQLITHSQQYHELVHDGAWSQSKSFCLFDFPITELTGKTFGLIGYGSLAKSVEVIAKAFGMNVFIAERKGADHIRESRVSFEHAISQSDIISVHSPLTPETENLIAEPEFNLMRSTAIVINTARGGIINEQDLLDAILEGKIAAAATDVLTQEPPKPDHVLLQQNLPNLIVTPHIAWASFEARTRLLKQVQNNIFTFIGLDS